MTKDSHDITQQTKYLRTSTPSLEKRKKAKTTRTDHAMLLERLQK